MPIEFYDPKTDTPVTVAPTSNAMAASRYSSDGAARDAVRAGSYICRFDIVPTTLTVLTVYFAMINPGPRVMAVRKLEYVAGFTGIAAATTSNIAFSKVTDNATYTGGTQLVPIRKDSNMSFPMADLRFAPGGLTAATGFAEHQLSPLYVPNQLSDDFEGYLDFTANRYDDGSPQLLAPGEAMIFQAASAIVSGVWIAGCIEWDEYTTRNEVYPR